MRRLASIAAAAALVAGTAGCVLMVSPFAGLTGRRELVEHVLEGEGRDKVLLVDVRGVITDAPRERAFGFVEEASTLASVQAALDRAAGEQRVRAVVLHVDSPGGGVTASDQIHAEVVRWKREQGVPVVAALGDVAASGGYYVACAADRIVAHPTTVTGSIGVVMVSLNLAGLLDKLGIENQTFKAGAHKDILSPLREATPAERRIVQRILDALHARFVAVVRASRPGLDAARLPELTDGRILDAADAAAAGLVDEIGSVRDAIAAAKRLAGIERARVVTYTRGGAARESIWAGATVPAPPALPLDPRALGVTGPRFMYLWTAGLVPP